MSKSSKLTILLVDDHAVVRMGYGMLLQQSEQVTAIIEAETGEQAYQRYVAEQPDIVIMDLSLPGAGGLAALRKIMRRDPAAKILVFSIHDELIYIKRAMEAGAKGYITKSCAPEILLSALEQVARNQVFIQPELAQQYITSQLEEDSLCITDKLSAREFEVFHLIAQGYSNQATAERLNLSIKTIANYVSTIKNKLNISTDVELAHLAYKSGLISK